MESTSTISKDDRLDADKLDDWVLVISPGLRYIGRLTSDLATMGTRVMTLNPAYEHFHQMQLVVGGAPNRTEAVASFDMVDGCDVQVNNPSIVVKLSDLPQWRRKEIANMLNAAAEVSKRFAIQKRSGLTLA